MKIRQVQDVVGKEEKCNVDVLTVDVGEGFAYFCLGHTETSYKRITPPCVSPHRMHASFHFMSSSPTESF